MRAIFSRHARVTGIGLVAAALSGATIVVFSSRSVSVEQGSLLEPVADLAVPAPLPETLPRLIGGGGCTQDGEQQRPVAVMLAGDTVARPLSGIAEAQIVVEMPVITDGINRLLAVFTCAGEKNFEVGSVRSARDDFIPLAAAFDAIYAHWGGSHFALDQLRRGIIDNVDALRNPFGAYFRKSGIVAPHNGFTTPTRLSSAAERLGYRLVLREDFEGYQVIEKSKIQNPNIKTAVTVGYPGAYRVEWRYDPDRERWLRWRGGTAETDANSRTQVSAGTIVVMRTTSRQIEGQYNDIRVTGSGEATVYRYGEVVEGRWEKAAQPLHAPLRFLDGNGAEIAFAEGSAWIEVVQTDTAVSSSEEASERGSE